MRKEGGSQVTARLRLQLWLMSLGRNRGGHRRGAVGGRQLGEKRRRDHKQSYEWFQIVPPPHAYPQFGVMVWHVYLLAGVLNDEVAPLLRPAQDVDLVSGPQQGVARVCREGGRSHQQQLAGSVPRLPNSIKSAHRDTGTS